MTDSQMAELFARLYLFMRQVRRGLRKNAQEVLVKSTREGCDFAEEDIAEIHKMVLELRKVKNGKENL